MSTANSKLNWPTFSCCTTLYLHTLLFVTEGIAILLQPEYFNSQNISIQETSLSLSYILANLSVHVSLVLITILYKRNDLINPLLGKCYYSLYTLFMVVLSFIFFEYRSNHRVLIFLLYMGCSMLLLYMSYFFTLNANSKTNKMSRTWHIMLGLPLVPLAIICFKYKLKYHKWITCINLAGYALSLITY